MKLLSFWRSLATFRVRIALNLKGLPVEPIFVDLDADAPRADRRSLGQSKPARLRQGAATSAGRTGGLAI